MIHRNAILLLLCMTLPAAGCGDKKAQNPAVTVAVAANMQFAMEALSKSFTDKTGIPCELIVGSSGKLTAQIREGAPYDLFVAANMKYPEEIERSGMAALPPRRYANGALVLWTMTNTIDPSLDILRSTSVRHIALANPKTAPYGQAAMDVLENIGMLEQVRDKLVYGESIAQTNQFIISGAAEIGFTALSVVLSKEMQQKGRWVRIPSDLHKPVEQGIVLLGKKSGASPRARELYEYLISAEAGEILGKFGYSVNE